MHERERAIRLAPLWFWEESAQGQRRHDLRVFLQAACYFVEK